MRDQQLGEVEGEPGIVVVDRELSTMLTVASDVTAAMQELTRLARQVIEDSGLVRVAERGEDFLLCDLGFAIDCRRF